MCLLVAIFAEFDIRVDRQRHEEDQNRVEQDQSRLSNVGVVWLPLVSRIGIRLCLRLTEKNDYSRESTNDSRVSALLHDGVYNRNRETTKHRRQGTHSPVWDVVGRVAVTNAREVEVALKTNKPSRKSEQQLRKWGVNVEIVFATQVVGGKLAKMDLVEAIAKDLVVRTLRRRETKTYTTWSGWFNFANRTMNASTVNTTTVIWLARPVSMYCSMALLFL